MKSFKTLSALCALAIMACGCNGKYSGFVLRGTFPADAASYMYLTYTDSLGQHILDSCLLKDGRFEFKGGIKEPVQALLSAKKLQSMEEKAFANIFLDPAEMNITLDDPGDLSKYVLTGSATNDLSAGLHAQKKALYAEMGELRKQEHASTDDAEKAAIGKELDEISRKVSTIDRNFIKNNPHSTVSAYILRFSLSSLEYQEANAMYEAFSEPVKNSSYGKGCLAELQRILRGEPGQKAKLFVKTDINGNELNLPELNKDHYLLIDFWASWCGPCRQGNPHLKELYKKYGPMGLLIVCIADNDTSPEKWKEAIEKDGIGEFRHVLRGLKQTADGFDRSEDLSENFGNSMLPTKYLIDKNGIIILKCGSDTEALDAKLKEIFGK